MTPRQHCDADGQGSDLPGRMAGSGCASNGDMDINQEHDQDENAHYDPAGTAPHSSARGGGGPEATPLAHSDPDTLNGTAPSDDINMVEIDAGDLGPEETEATRSGSLETPPGTENMPWVSDTYSGVDNHPRRGGEQHRKWRFCRSSANFTSAGKHWPRAGQDQQRGPIKQ